ncbi:type II secretion system protein [Neoasaia chiangmaiensis NBRC 101099]|nr:type II secretion system F family protein [Neoasaia chiangmaiensis]GBR37467.1 type II secretion system protein [Neoasaia chiangmaiensis NBRC 101099]GEN14966.1 type II secretion system protein GspF [Neoasaia chiangmaiensis]
MTGMIEFSYLAVDKTGVVSKGTLQAESETAAVARLRQTGQIPMLISAIRPSIGQISWLHVDLPLRKDLRHAELTLITRELAVMLEAGQDIDHALRFLVQTLPGSRGRRVLEEIRAEVRNGKSLHKAMAARPKSFPHLYIAMVRAAEAGGDLAPTMAHLAQLMERTRALRATITSAMIYPALLIVAACGSIYLLLTSVLPQFVPLFEQNGVALPPTTQLLVDIGRILEHDSLIILLVLLIAIVALTRLLRRSALRRRVDYWLLRVPLLNALMREIMAARFARIFGTLLENGVPILNALDIARDALRNVEARHVIEVAMQNTKAGRGLSGAVGGARIFPERMVHLLQLGEETGRLGTMSLRAADIHEEQVRIVTQRLLAIFVPVVTIIMGLVIAGIVSSLLLAMLSINDLAQ